MKTSSAQASSPGRIATPILAEVVQKYGPPLCGCAIRFPHTHLHHPRTAKKSFSSLRKGLRPSECRRPPAHAKRFLKLTDAELLRIGFSRPENAVHAAARRISFAPLFRLGISRSADDARAKCSQHKGIGKWTADIYLLSACAAGHLATAIWHWPPRCRSKAPSPASFAGTPRKMSAPWRPCAPSPPACYGRLSWPGAARTQLQLALSNTHGTHCHARSATADSFRSRTSDPCIPVSY